ncbi:MAG: PLP-dependent cysteine synthase family protein [Chloroflexota bacterium]|nr:PLP-dependent cysteine synthase family protein [Chloroflexota bacterium]
MITQVQTIATSTVTPSTQVKNLEGVGLIKSIGNTPLLPLNQIARHISPCVSISAKAEWFNPGGSVKDRPAFNIIRAALFDGHLLPGMRLLDSTSGNMGIAYATFGAALDIAVTLVMSSSVSRERVAILRALGAELILTDADKGSDGAIKVARQMAEEHPDRYYYANQYDNPANWQAHYNTTGSEIIAQTEGKITHFVAGLGTSGTIMGVSRALRENNPEVEIITVQPDRASDRIEGLKHIETAIKPGIFDPDISDRTLKVSTKQAREMVRRLAREQGYFVGVSAGAAAAAAVRVAEELDQGVVVTLFPDAGYKYLSDEALWNGN